MRKSPLSKCIGLCLVLCFLITACEEESRTLKDFGKDFWPVSVGDYHTYKIDSFVYDGINQRIDTFSHLIRETVTDVLKDSADVKRYRVERAVWFDDLFWRPYFAYSVQVSNNSVQTFVDNVREVRLSFPVNESKYWDGFIYSTTEEQEYQYLNILEPFQIDTIFFPETVTVLQNELIILDPPIIDSYRKEVFAKGVGMVYKVDRDLDLQDNSGREIIYTLLDYKK